MSDKPSFERVVIMRICCQLNYYFNKFLLKRGHSNDIISINLFPIVTS